MPTVNIVLVEPQIPQNTGNIARTCAVTGARLHLVGPMGFTIDDKKLKRAGLDYWGQLDITYYQDLDAFFAANHGPFFYFTSKGPQRIPTPIIRMVPIWCLAARTLACRKSCWPLTSSSVCACPCAKASAA